jgi:N-dimethylarginine dimethylaminohydrolase
MATTETTTKTQYDEWIEALQKREWKLSDVPFYEPGEDPDISKWHNVDYLDVYEKIYGRKIGSNGIGKLREVSLTRIRESERPPLWEDDPAWFEGTGVTGANAIDIKRMQEQQEHYASVLEENGVTVNWIDFPDPPMSAYGPMQHMWAAQELLIINGGSVIAKPGWHPYSFGRTEFLARWAFWHLGIPPICTIVGKGVNEAGASLFLAQDVFLTAISAAYNQDGVAQLEAVMRRTAGIEPFHIQIMRMPSAVYFDPKSGVSAHPDMVVGPLDIRKAAIFSSGVDTGTHLWLREHGYQLAEVDFDEHLLHCPANLTILEPGLVVMQSESPKSITTVRKLGVEVIEVPYSEFNKAGGGFACSTQLVYREPGPALLS